MESLKEAIKNEIKNILNENEDKEEKKASKGAKKTTKGIKALDKEAEKLKDQKKKLQAKIKPLVQDFNAKKIDRANKTIFIDRDILNSDYKFEKYSLPKKDKATIRRGAFESKIR